MTLLSDPPTPDLEPAFPAEEPAPVRVAAPAAAPAAPQRMRVLFVVWLVALIAGLALVVFGFGPVFQDRDQRSMLRGYQVELDHAANGGAGFNGSTAAPTAPAVGSTVGILEVGRIHLQEAIVEGVSSSETRKGPGHVPGTAGLGQPGNSVVVGRRQGFGAPFSGVGSLHKGDEMVVTTTQGQSVYKVTKVDHVKLHNPPAQGTGGVTAGHTLGGSTDDTAGLIDTVYGPSNDDQLTLVTSGSRAPWNKSRATVVIAKMADAPYPPTVQGGRQAGVTGGKPDSDAKAAAVLCFLLYGFTLGGAVLLHRRLAPRVAYLLTVAPIVAMTIVTGETFSRLFPAWM